MADGRVYLASAYGSGPGGGVLIALNASTGRLLWKFNTVIGQGAGVQALGLGSGGAWETPLVGSNGSVTFGIGNPYQSIGQAIAHPSRQLYTDSEVNLDAATGKLRWYYQAVPDDFQDHDLQASPISAGGRPQDVEFGRRRQPVAGCLHGPLSATTAGGYPLQRPPPAAPIRAPPSVLHGVGKPFVDG